MLIFNTTYHIEEDSHGAFLDFITKNYIPAATGSGFLHAPCLCRIRPQHETNGYSYSLQFKVKNSDVLEYWLTQQGEELQKQLLSEFGQKLAGFVTLMDEIDLS